MTLHKPTITLYTMIGALMSWLGYHIAVLVELPATPEWINHLFALTVGGIFIYLTTEIGDPSLTNGLVSVAGMLAIYFTWVML